jgi:hypothetical protein
MSTTWRLGPTQTVTLKQSSPGLLEVEAVWDGGGELPPPHFNP